MQHGEQKRKGNAGPEFWNVVVPFPARDIFGMLEWLCACSTSFFRLPTSRALIILFLLFLKPTLLSVAYAIHGRSIVDPSNTVLPIMSFDRPPASESATALGGSCGQFSGPWRCAASCEAFSLAQGPIVPRKASGQPVKTHSGINQRQET